MFKIAIPKLIISVVVPLICAELVFAVNSEKRQGVYRMLLLVPVIAPGVVGTLIWKAVYDPANGIMTNIIRALGIISSDVNIDWLGDSKYVIFSIGILEVCERGSCNSGYSDDNHESKCKKFLFHNKLISFKI